MPTVYLSLFAGAGQQFFDNTGKPLAGGKLYTYAAGTSTPQATYTTSAGTIAQANPMVLDSAGRVPVGGEIWIPAGVSVKFVLQDSTGVTIQTLDNISAGNDPTAVLALLSASSGSSLVGFIGSGAGSVARTVQSKLRDTVSLKDFGAAGDGSTNDTAAISAAVSWMISTGYNVSVPPGIYMTDPFTINGTAYAGQATLIGSDRERCIIRRRTTGAGAFVTYGSSGGVIFQSGVGFENLTIDGGVTTNGDTFVGYDVVRSNFYNTKFLGGSIACHLYGGIDLTFYGCTFDSSTYGVKIEKFTSGAGGGWPNLIKFIGGEIINNSIWGLWFDYGRMLELTDLDIESNGTTLGAAQGGVYIGPNVGTEVSISDTYSIGLVANGIWFEANKGAADVSLNSGINSIQNSNFFTTAAQNTNDVVINGGRYFLTNVNMSFAKTANVLENAGTITGSLIMSSDIPNTSVTGSKTMVMGLNKIQAYGGALPVVAGLSVPYIQMGTVSTGAGAGVDVTFAQAYTSAPMIYATVNNGASTTTLTQGVISAVTTTGFHISGTQMTSGSSTLATTNLAVNWLAIGTL